MRGTRELTVTVTVAPLPVPLALVIFAFGRLVLVYPAPGFVIAIRLTEPAFGEPIGLRIT